MKPNPDEFVFHSNFEYNAAVIKGYKDFSNVPLPATFELVSGMQAGDRFRVYEEFNGVVYSMGGPFPTFNYYSEGGKLYATVGAQQPGTLHSTRFHYKVYRKNKDFIFNSKTNIEKVIFTAKGTMSAGYANNLTLTNTTGKKLALYATWRVAGANTWYSDGYSGSSPSGVLGLENTPTNITMRFGAGNGTAANIEYRIVGTDLYGT